LSIIGHVLFTNVFYEYHYFWLTYPYLFVCLLYVRWSYNVCVIREQMLLQIILA